MSFRNDLDAARERVRALEREVAGARKRSELDQKRLYQLEVERYQWTPLPRAPKFPFRARSSATSVFVWVTVIFIVMAVAISSSPHPIGSWIVYPKIKLRNVARGAAITFLEAKGVDGDGNFHVHARGDFSLRTQGNKCESMTWTPGSALTLSRLEIACPSGAARLLRCSPIEIRNRFGQRSELVSMRYLDGKWAVASPNGRSAVIDDDCAGQFWPPASGS